jgi:hypothetical protein
MKKYFLCLILSITGMVVTAQELMFNYEIWGWKGTKEEFVKYYKDKTKVDLHHGYCCMASLDEMGYKYSLSTIYSDNYNDFNSGNVDWDVVKRLTIIRQPCDNKYIRMASDTSWLIPASKSISSVFSFDNAAINQLFTDNPSRLEDLLTGTLAVNKFIDLRNDCCLLLDGKIDFCKCRLSDTDLEIVATMLSFPNPQTCYSAMRIISKTKEDKNKKILFKEGAETLKDFLGSNMETFRTDAKNFLIELEPSGKDWTPERWINWLESNTAKNL